MKTSSVFKLSILPFITFCSLVIVPLYTNNAQTVEHIIAVVQGWNMVGSLCDGKLSEIVSDPEEIIISNFWEYVDGYKEPEPPEAPLLIKGRGYWVKVKQAGSIIFKCPCVSCQWTCGDSIDYGGKTYNTVKIGEQCWLKENLDVGTMIDSLQNQTKNDTIEKYCYHDDPANCEIYGGLYQWNEAMQYVTTPEARGICPMGWHIPTMEEFQTLSNTVGGDGNALKAIGQGIPPDGEGTNTSGFSALLAGGRSFNGSYLNLSYSTLFWSSTKYEPSSAYVMYLYYGNGIIGLDYRSEVFGFSVRCLQD